MSIVICKRVRQEEATRRSPHCTEDPPSRARGKTMTDMYDEKKVPEFTLPPYQHEDHGSEVSCFFVGVLLLVVVVLLVAVRVEMLGGEQSRTKQL